MNIQDYFGKLYIYPIHNFRLGTWQDDSEQTREFYARASGWACMNPIEYQNASSRVNRDGTLREANPVGFTWVGEHDRQIYVYDLTNFHAGSWVNDNPENRNSALSIRGRRFVEGGQYRELAKKVPLSGDMTVPA